MQATDCVNVGNLAAFKRFLARPGATLTMERHDFVPPGHRNFDGLHAPRQVAELKSTRVGLCVRGKDRPSWLDLSRASEFRFIDGNQVVVDLGEDGRFEHVIIYRLSINH